MTMRGLLLAAVLVLAGPAFAVQPDEILADPALEARARALSEGLRCPVCQGETIDESNAPIARDMRLVLRERLVAGDSDAEAVAYLTDRYGEFILFRPRATGANLFLWFAAPVLLLSALVGAGLYVRRSRAAERSGPLSEAEEARLAELLKD
ncbi:cytochrome c-type biogenesis protein CcmH [Frigidibacter sp. RF13]|uniref:cytochrome c-type biogenesis protein n=1 Tax=Frigidibacter sp. RF13 TaxID=2997340 RepID=UPI002270CCD7|nr:cytochrome c-type biogenesis protein [Frigidibacter sp. RF13]MCY1127865.1 cytochrome c-type biogenesis protein CcmH [Frigidibacter sp. RF13]